MNVLCNIFFNQLFQLVQDGFLSCWGKGNRRLHRGGRLCFVSIVSFYSSVSNMRYISFLHSIGMNLYFNQYWYIWIWPGDESGWQGWRWGDLKRGVCDTCIWERCHQKHSLVKHPWYPTYMTLRFNNCDNLFYDWFFSLAHQVRTH